MKNLYVNGCSFTAGHVLKEEESWPYLLAKKLNLNLIKHARNGQSFDSIFLNTISHLSELDPKDTLVVIGTTWSTRFSVLYDDLTINLTPGDYQKKKKKHFHDKLGGKDRIGSPYSLEKINYNDIKEKYYENGNMILPTEEKIKFDEVLTQANRYYNTLFKYDDNFYKNQHLKLISKVVSLQCFLEHKNFKFRFVDFENVLQPSVEGLQKWEEFSIHKLIEDKNFVYLKRFWKSHPNSEDCIKISEAVYDSINR
tara:strand:+ start:468 stop:1229 length:762 start_codon:yes stop_codon:yes gene_type:complete